MSVSFGARALFNWKGKSCPDGEAGTCCLGHGDILSWMANCPLRTGVVCCLPTFAQGSSAAVTRVMGYGAFLAFWVLLGVLCIWGALALLVYLLVCTGLGLRRCAYRWTRPLGGGRWGHSLRFPPGVHWFAQNRAQFFAGWSMVLMHVWCVG